MIAMDGHRKAAYLVVVMNEDGDEQYQQRFEYAPGQADARKMARELLEYVQEMSPPGTRLAAYIYAGHLSRVNKMEDWTFEADPAVKSEVVR